MHACDLSFASYSLFVCSLKVTNEEKQRHLINWTRIPGSVDCQPLGGQDHLVPLFTVFGIAHGDTATDTGTDAYAHDDNTVSCKALKMVGAGQIGSGLVSSNFLWGSI